MSALWLALVVKVMRESISYTYEPLCKPARRTEPWLSRSITYILFFASVLSFLSKRHFIQYVAPKVILRCSPLFSQLTKSIHLATSHDSYVYECSDELPGVFCLKWGRSEGGRWWGNVLPSGCPSSPPWFRTCFFSLSWLFLQLATFSNMPRTFHSRFRLFWPSKCVAVRVLSKSNILQINTFTLFRSPLNAAGFYPGMISNKMC